MADEVFKSLLIHTCTIKRPEETIGSFKKPTLSYTTKATGVICRIKSLSADTLQAIGGAVYDADYKIYFEDTVDVIEKDIIITTSAGVSGNYEVRGVEKYPDGNGIHHLTVMCKKKLVF